VTTPHVVLNGLLTPLTDATAHTTALNWLRDHGATGVKEGCAEGECGACAVLVAREIQPGRTAWIAVNSCLIPAAALDGQEVVTAEGLGSPGALHPVQSALAVGGGSQCGYCTPGIVASMAAEFYREDRLCQHSDGGCNGFELEALSGNLCRCTGYRPIRDAAVALSEPDPADRIAARRTSAAPAPQATLLSGPRGEFRRPASLAEALRLLREHPDTQVVAGGTDYGVDVNLKNARPRRVLAIDRLPELRALVFGSESISIGAALTLTEVEHGLTGRIPLLDKLFPHFSSRLIRNRATLGGNLGTASPIGDSPPALLSLEAVVELRDADGARWVPVADFFTGYRATVRRPGELITAVTIPVAAADPTITAFHKIAKRRYDDISAVSVGYAIDVSHGIVTRARIGLGGVAATPQRARATEAALEGRPWSAEAVAAAAAIMAGEGTPMSDHRASAAYRCAMLGQSLLKLIAETPWAATPVVP